MMEDIGWSLLSPKEPCSETKVLNQNDSTALCKVDELENDRKRYSRGVLTRARKIRRLQQGHAVEYRVCWRLNETEKDGDYQWTSGDHTQSYSPENLKMAIGDCVVTHMRIDGVVPPDLHTLAPRLTHLYVEDAESTIDALKTTEFSELKVLHLSHCDFSSGLPRIGSVPTSLQELYLMHCQLTELPRSISQLTSLERLDVSHNNFSAGLPNIISELVSLKALYLSYCELTDLPQTLDRLTRLQFLDLVGNMFIHVPPNICVLRHLQTLDLSQNVSLQTIDFSIISMPKLSDIRVDGCRALHSPPLVLCKQGPQAIKQYCMDILMGTGPKVSVAIIAVIGNSLAGKTSLMRTLQCPSKKRKLTRCSDIDTLHDEAIKVFTVEKVQVEDAVLHFMDMGGHEIYQLLLKPNCVPLVVVNMEEYKQLADANGAKEAVRIVCFDRVFHLYLVQPSIEHPKLVLTHKDKFTQHEFQQLMDEFLITVKSLHESIVLEEGHQQNKLFPQIERFSNVDTPMFKPEDIFAIGDTADHYEVFDSIRFSLYQACQQHVRTIPRIWEEIDHSLQSRDGFSRIDELLSDLHQTHGVDWNQLEIVLAYMHDTGKLLWYKNIPALCHIVFHRIPQVIEVLNILNTHNTNTWQKRLNNFVPFITMHHQQIEREFYNHLIESFKETGIMDQVLLFRILQTETTFRNASETDIALAILKSFYLIYGPMRRHTEMVYVIPSYAVGNLDQEPDGEKDLNFQVDILFKGLALPQYIYYQMTTTLLEMFPSETDTLVVKGNGATIVHGSSVISLIHDFKMRKVTIHLSANIDRITQSWKQLMDIANKIIKHTSSTWSASKMMCIFYCPHCLLKGDMHPKKTVNPAWCTLSDTRPDSDVRYRLYSGTEPVVCGSARDVPMPLKFPCTGPTPSELEELRKYIVTLKKRKSSLDPGALETGSLPCVTDRVKRQAVADHAGDSNTLKELESLDSLLSELLNVKLLSDDKMDEFGLMTELDSIGYELAELSRTVETLTVAVINRNAATVAKPVEPVQQMAEHRRNEQALQGAHNITATASGQVVQRDKAGRTPLHVAKDREIAESLLKGIEPDKQIELLLANDERQQTALHVAAEYDRADVVKYLIEFCKEICVESIVSELVFCKDKAGRTALHGARDRDVVEIIITAVEPDKQRDLLLATDKQKRTVLHVAADYGRTDVVQYLIDRCSSISVETSNDLVLKKDIQANTALHYADNREIAELLVNAVESDQRRTLILASNVHRRTAVHKAAKERRTDVVKYLTTTYNDILKDSILGRDFKGKTALHYACNGDIAGLLVDAVSPDQLLGFLLASDYNQRSALHTAAKYGRTDVVERLCNHTLADDKLMLKRDQPGRTALYYASDKTTAAVLIGAVEDKLDYLNMVDNDGNTAVMYHISSGSRVDVVSYILEYIVESYALSDLKQHLQRRNSLKQNYVHLIGISPYINEFSEILLEYLHILDIEKVIQADAYGNTPLSYVASRYSTKNFAEFITRMSLSQRKHFVQQTNEKGVDCLSIVQREQFSETFYLSSVLCDQKGAKGQIDYFWAFESSFREDFKYDENMLRVLKYALNEYSLLDPVYTISHALFSRSFDDTFIKRDPSDDAADANPRMLASTSTVLFIGDDELNLSVIQNKLNSLDIPEKHGKPKVVVIRTLDAASISKLTPPGPDYLIVSTLYTKLSNTRFSSVLSVDALVDELRTDVNVEYVSVNSTLGRRYLRDVSVSESCVVMSPVDQILISGRNRGKALIICNRRNRYDWQQEFEHANHVLTYHFGLQVELALDLAAAQILDTVSRFSNSAGHGSLVALAIMTHGDNLGNIAGDDGESTVSVQEVVDSLCVPQLETTPKIALLSFCRGGVGRVNRTDKSFECTTLVSMTTSMSFNPLRRGLNPAQLTEERQSHPFPSLDVPLNCYVCFSTLPDSKSFRGTMFRCFTEYLTDMYKHSPLKEGEDVDPDTSVYKRELPRVELIELFTDVAGVVRETSQFTQYMNYCYKLNKDSQPVVIEIIPTRRDIF